jgi:hypothetical protein
LVLPGRGFNANGPAGGPFNTPTQILTLTNTGTADLSWSLSPTPSWLDSSVTGGALSQGGPATLVTLSLNNAANKLATGVYSANIWFTNTISGTVQNRQFTISIGQDLVQDGGFEAGDFAYWTLAGGDAAGDSFVDDGTTTGVSPHGGLYFAALGQTNSLAHLFQTIPTRAGQLYWLSVWLQSIDVGNGTSPNELVVKCNTKTVFDERNVAASGWTNLQLLVQANTSNTVLDFGFRDDPGYLALDDVELVPVPAPTVQLVDLAGGSLTFGWSSVAGLHYQLQYTTDLVPTAWIDLGPRVTASGSFTTQVETTGPDPQRFYRVLLLP